MAKHHWLNRKKLLSPRNLAHLLICLALVYLCYIFGLFTHLLERDLNDFKYPLEVDIRIAIDNLKQHNQLLADGPSDRFSSADDESLSSLDVNKLNYTFLFNPERKCRTGEPPLLVILVKSKYSNFRYREAIRKTWGQASPLTRTFFLVGLPAYADLNSMDAQVVDEANRRANKRRLSPIEHYHLVLSLSRDSNKVNHFNKYLNNKYSSDERSVFLQLDDEQRKHGDLIQQNFHDTYFNNTLKTLMGLKWVNNHCSNAKYYLFIDDDYFLNPSLLVNDLIGRRLKSSPSSLDTLYAGYVFADSAPMRHILSKWYVPLDEYPYSRYPPYVSAGCYLMSVQSVRLFYMASKLIELFRLDDIYMGILAHKLDVKPVHVDNIHFYAPKYSPELFSNSVIAAHQFEPDKLEEIWREIGTKLSIS